MLTDDIVAQIVRSIPEPVGDETAVWISDLCFAIEAEVRKQGTTLIQQLVDALEDFDYDKRIAAITAGRVRLEDKP